MADREEIAENLEDRSEEVVRDSTRRKSTKHRGSKKRPNSGGSEGTVRIFPGQDPGERRNENSSREGSRGRRVDGKQDPPPIQEDHRAQFFEDYRKEAEEYDREFIKKYDEDLNTTLIFAGLFSAVTAAFIIQVLPQLQPDPSQETTALLRVLIHKIDNTTFGTQAPALPQWTGPPQTIVQVQAILFASLITSLFSAFLAMLGKQWLNRYASTDMRGTAIERSQNRQRKLDGIIAWYFDHVMESLPLMLQAALLLLDCALARYLWRVNTIVASVVLGATVSGVILYLFIVAAGVASEDCPYQTPGAQILRRIFPAIASSGFVQNSRCRHLLVEWWPSLEGPWYSTDNITNSLLIPPFMFIAVATDAYLLGQATLRSLVDFGRTVYCRFSGTSSQPHILDQQTTALDLRCISWMVQTSSDKAVHLSTLKHLATMVTLDDFRPALVADCFNVFIDCVNTGNFKVMIMQGLEELATVSATCFFRTFHHLSVVDPTSSVLEGVRKRYDAVFPFETDFRGLPFYYTMAKIHALANQHWWCPRYIQWGDYRPSAQEHIPVARDMVEAARAEYQKTQCKKVPRWILRFALHSLSLDPPPPISVIVHCLSIIAIDLGCDVTYTGSFDESERVKRVLSQIAQKLNAMAEIGDRYSSWYKRKAITALLPFMVRQEREGQQEMLDTFLRAERASRELGFMWYRIKRCVGTLLHEASPRTVVLVLPCIPWNWLTGREDLIQRWASAVSAVPYTEECAQGVVNMLLQIASEEKLLPYLTVGVWRWLIKRPALPPVCRGRDVGTTTHVVGAVQDIKDVEILKSYFLVAWSEWDSLRFDSFCKMRASIREDFCGVGMGRHRADLVRHLDHVLGQLDRGLEYLKHHNPNLNEGFLQAMRYQYRKLRETLLETDIEAVTRSRATFMCALPGL